MPGQNRIGTSCAMRARLSVVALLLAGRQGHGRLLLALVGNHVEDVADDVEAGPALVVGVGHVPGRRLGVRGGEHGVACPRVVVPAAVGLEVHRRELPGLAAVVDAGSQAARLLLLADLEPVLEQDHARVDDCLLDEGNELEEPGRLLFRAKAHDRFDPGAVVPASIEDHDLTPGGKVGDVALHVHLRAFTLVGGGQCDDPEDPGAHPLGEPLDDAALSRGVPALEHDAHLGVLLHDPALQVHELDLQALELLLVLLASHLGGWHCSAISHYAVARLASIGNQPIVHQEAEGRVDKCLSFLLAPCGGGQPG